MAWTRKGSYLAVISYLLVAVVVLGGLTWATVLAVRLDRAEQLAQQERDRSWKLRRALALLDRFIQVTLSRETVRPPDEYNLFTFPQGLLDPYVQRIERGAVMAWSPWLDGSLEPWLLGPFQGSPVSEWSSPAVEAEHVQETMAFPDGYPAPGLPDARRVVYMLRHSYSPGEVADLLDEARRRDGEQGAGGDVDLGQRQALQFLGQPPEVCDRRDLDVQVGQNLRLAQEWPADVEYPGVSIPDYDLEVADEVSWVSSWLSGVWLDLDDGPEPYLAFVRTVSSPDGNELYQGVVVDWEMLRELLLEEINNLFPGANLLPVRSEPVEDPETLMTYVPVRLDVSCCPAPKPAAGWHPVHTGLLFAWIAAVIVLIAAGVGVKGLLTLADRRSQFAYAVSHELRTPLTTFRLYTDMLADGLVPEEKRDEYLKTLSTESQRLTQLVGGVLEYSQLEHHALQPTLEDVTIQDLLHTAAERFTPRCEEAGLHLIVKAEEGEAVCRTDVELTLQIIGTLFDNACKYAGEATKREVHLNGAPGPGSRARFEVQDFGPGVPKGKRRSIFKPFRRGQRGATASPGLGLGLALADRWASLLDGKLELISERSQDSGARFRLTLPLQHRA